MLAMSDFLFLRACRRGKALPIFVERGEADVDLVTFRDTPELIIPVLLDSFRQRTLG